MVYGSGFRVWGSAYDLGTRSRVKGLGIVIEFRIQDLRFRV
jgi:hypothetical protein